MKRLFFGYEAECPWPDTFPEGQILLEKDRHLTVKFLGMVKDDPEWPLLPLIGYGAVFDQIFTTQHVVGWHVNLSTFDSPHVTLARAPFDLHAWEKAFTPLPVIFYKLHLYESLGNSHYQPLETRAALAPFEEIEHMADIAFKVHAIDFPQLYWHAKLALAFRDPSFLKTPNESPQTFEEVVFYLNRHIQECDSEYGTPFKAVSYHGEIQESSHLTWDMIVDV